MLTNEYANVVTNGAYTMLLIRTILNGANRFRQQFSLPANPLWTRQAAALDVPTISQAGIYIEYTGMNGSIEVKQADVVLIDDFLDYATNYLLTDLSYYASRQSAHGAGMTFAVFSVVAAEISQAGCEDHTYDLYGSQPYSRAPFFQMSEQLVDDYSANGGTLPAFPLLTGHGGANRVTVLGFLGLRLCGDSFNINPSLPPQIPYLRYRTIYWQGHGISASSNITHTTLTRLPASRPLSTANPTYFTTPIPVTVGYNTTT